MKRTLYLPNNLSNGQLDTSWQTNGYRIFPNQLLSGDARSYSLLIDNDDKIVLVGYENGPNRFVFRIIKLDTDGNFDVTFDGSLVFPHPDLYGTISLIGTISPNSSFNDVAIDNSNNIIVAGQFMDISGVWNWKKIIMRITPTGDFDTTLNSGLLLGDAPPPFYVIPPGAPYFGPPLVITGGLIIIDDDPADGGANEETLKAINVLPDNSIVTSGFDVSGGNATFYIAHIDAAGTTINKRGFAEGGAGFVVPFSKAQSQVMIDNSHFIVVGSTLNPTTFIPDFALAKYNITTIPIPLDNTFGTNGIVTTDIFNQSHDEAFVVRLDSDKNIIVGGFSTANTGVPQLALVKYKPDGTLFA